MQETWSKRTVPFTLIQVHFSHSWIGGPGRLERSRHGSMTCKGKSPRHGCWTGQHFHQPCNIVRARGSKRANVLKSLFRSMANAHWTSDRQLITTQHCTIPPCSLMVCGYCSLSLPHFERVEGWFTLNGFWIPAQFSLASCCGTRMVSFESREKATGLKIDLPFHTQDQFLLARKFPIKMLPKVSASFHSPRSSWRLQQGCHKIPISPKWVSERTRESEGWFHIGVAPASNS